MTLKEQISKDIIQAMRDKNKLKKAVLTVIKASIQNEEIKLKKEALSEDDEMTILNRERKQTKDALAEFEKANREDLIEQEKQKLVIIESYLPKQLSEEDIRNLLVELNIPKDAAMGPVIGRINADYKGQVEGRVVSKVVKEYLGK